MESDVPAFWGTTSITPLRDYNNNVNSQSIASSLWMIGSAVTMTCEDGALRLLPNAQEGQ